jgi:hypothetical protein
MQRWLSTLLGMAAIALAITVVVRTMSDRPGAAHTESHPDAAPSASAALDSAKPKDAGPIPAASGSADPMLVDPGADLGATEAAPGHFPDGRPVPPLPAGSPKQVRLGVVLMAFAGAQGAAPTARPKKEALELATKLASDAKTDFHAAVIRGDSGSSDDIGRIARGVLEPATEYLVFTLAVGGVSDPIETPRGYWIAKRKE